MLHHIERLTAAANYTEAVEVARRTLAGDSLPAEQRLQILRLLARALTQLQDHKGAVEAAAQAAQLARSNGSAAHLAPSLFELGMARKGLRALDQAAATLRELLGLLPPAGNGVPDRGEVLYQLGTLYAEQADAQAPETLQAARDAFLRAGAPQRAEECRRALANYLVTTGQLDAAEPVLLQGDQYLTEHPTDHVARTEHLLTRARYALARRDYMEAARRAEEALQCSGNDPRLHFQAYMITYQTADAISDYRGALKYALLARIATLQAHLFEQEFQATMAFIECRDRLGEDEAVAILVDIYKEFLHRGVDIYQYLPEALFRKRQA